ncbi:transposase [Paucilactobacillus hokkaidonensis JCM 18461]|uniref:Transposase n=2 Tax=Paucilactobacillus hokkaidonensis TaxID=1193095 RepID=A0A0A1GSK7_9LACO|nr:IS66 family insertion sequence element accessory protein TnpB [Paucilactobacillus hokkaidonensis]KRO09322.1 element, Orf2 protein, IS66 family [Paucilactobacillus hokkaidonensis]BAP85262.1 transposase [Paucilactobacillus hokkaidonensis JCM 18461]
MNRIIDFSKLDKVYLVCGKTDLRKGIDGLATIVQEDFNLDPFSPALFLFCGTRKDRFKAIYWEGDGFVLLYKRYESGHLQWPRSVSEARQITAQQLQWLLNGLTLEPSVHAVRPGSFY